MVSRNETGLVPVDNIDNDTRLEPHLQDLKKLHECFPEALWPRVEAAPTEMGTNNRLLLYPGRVLVGYTGEQPIWAYLWQVNYRGDTSLDFYIGDTRKQVVIGNSEDRIFWARVKFQQWCKLLSSTLSPAGFAGGWEVNVKSIVKIVMLERGYYDGTVSVSRVLSTIRQNQLNEAPEPSSPSASRDDQPECASSSAMPQLHMDLSSDVGFEDVASPGASQFVRHDHSLTSNKSRTPLPGILSRHILVLQDAYPPNVWPRVEECDRESAYYYPGKVYLGKYNAAPASKGSSSSLWARVVKKQAHRERFGHVICADDHGKIVSFRKGNLVQRNGLSTYLVLDTPFQLIDNGKQCLQAMKLWRVNMYTCVRIALVAKGFIDGPELTMGVASRSPNNIAAIIKKNLETANSSGALSHPESLRQSLGLSSKSELRSRQATSTVPAKRGHDALQGAEDDRSRASTGITVMPNKVYVKEQKQKSSISPDLFHLMKKALPSKPGSPTHTEITTLKESIVALQAEVTDLKDKIDVQDIDHAELDEKTKLQDEQLNEITSESKNQAANLQALRAELKAVKMRNAALVAGRITVESRNLALEAKIGELQAETDALKTFKQTHIREAQPLLVSLMTMENQVDGMDEDDARRAAELRYVDMFGVAIAESENGE